MPQIKPPRLYRNRCGVYYFRLKTAESDRRFSLRTKCPTTAAIIALDLNSGIERKRAMRNPKLTDILPSIDPDKMRQYEIDLRNRVFKSNSKEDHRRLLEAVREIGKLPPEAYPAYPSHPALTVIAPAPATLKSPPLPEVAALWITERTAKNAPRTIYAKERHFADFSKRLASDIEINAVTKALIVGYKSALLTAGQKGKTIDNKLMSLSDLFEYAMAHGYYTASNANPVSGLFIQTQADREAKNEPFEPFTPQDLKTFFDATAYRKAMTMPDFFWAPLLGIFTGMRISEATAIQCDDVLTAPNGVSYIHVRKSKTSAGVRNVPLCDALITLGFLDYVAEVRAINAKFVFPHRKEIKGTHSKRLSERMTSYLIELGIRTASDDKEHKSFHSFRVNVSTDLANAGANTMQVMKIVGHKNEKGTKVHAGYVRELPDLKKEVDKLTWPIDLPALKYGGEFNAFLTAGQWDQRKKKAS